MWVVNPFDQDCILGSHLPDLNSSCSHNKIVAAELLGYSTDFPGLLLGLVSQPGIP
jgi:hypothetical protein